MFRVACAEGEVGIDWLTLQGRTTEEKEWIWAAWNDWLDLNGLTAGTLQPKRLSAGYALTLNGRGVTWHQTGRCSLWASGEEASTLASRKGIWLPSVSRVDIQATVRLKRPSEALHRKLRDHWRSDFSPKAYRMYKRIIESDTGATVELGKRTSPRFLRVYDKGSQQGTAPTGSVWRFELELKGKQADDNFHEWIGLGRPQSRLCGLLQAYLRKVGVELAIPNILSDGAMAALRPQVPDVESRVKWLSHSVRPVVAQLARSGHLEDALRAMGLHKQEGEIQWQA